MEVPHDTIVGRLVAMATRAPNQTFCVHYAKGQHEDVSYARLLREARATAECFKRWGCDAGDVVLLFLKHEPELYSAFLGAMIAGCIPSYMPYPSPKQNHTLFWRSHAALLDRIKPRLLLVSPELVALFQQNLPDYAAIIQSSHDIGNDGAEGGPIVWPDPDDIAFLQHSSGTTALKKGVMLSHRAVLLQTDAYADAIGFSNTDIVASWLPLYHDMGLIACFVLTLVSGATLIALDPFEWVSSPVLLLDAIERHRATFCWLPNFSFNHLAASVRRRVADRDLSSIRAFVNCSEPCRSDSFDLFLRRFAEAGVREDRLQVCYAMAENVFAVSQSPLGQGSRVLNVDRASFETDGRIVPGDGLRLLSCGKPIDGVNLKIIGNDGEELPDGRIGEVMITSPFLFDGYYRQADITSQRLKSGWYYSGDLGFLMDGELYITGRKDDLLIAYGRNYYAHEIEAIANDVADVVPGRCVAFAVTSKVGGTQQVVLLVETRTEDAASLISRLREAVLANSGLALTHVILRPPGSLVKTTSGKISRDANRAQFLAEQG